MSNTAEKNGIATTADVAIGYHDRGLRPIPVPFKSKNPGIEGWQNLCFTRDQLAGGFAGRTNIGVVLGAPSRGVIDVDLDHALAIELAPQYLPPTKAIFGRASKRRSHWEYKLTREAETKKFTFPKSEPKRELDGKMIVEFRSTGCQTVFPGSVHESGEPIEWASDGDPAEVDPDELLASIAELALEVQRRSGYKPDDATIKVLQSPSRDGRDGRTINTAPLGVIDRARKYLGKMPPAVSGGGGHDQTIYVAGKLIRGFGLPREQALQLLREYNQRCKPPWSEKELAHKIDDAIERPGERG